MGTLSEIKEKTNFDLAIFRNQSCPLLIVLVNIPPGKRSVSNKSSIELSIFLEEFKVDLGHSKKKMLLTMVHERV